MSPKVTLHELLKEMAEDEGLSAEVREKAKAAAEEPKVKAAHLDCTRARDVMYAKRDGREAQG